MNTNAIPFPGKIITCIAAAGLIAVLGFAPAQAAGIFSSTERTVSLSHDLGGMIIQVVHADHSSRYKHHKPRHKSWHGKRYAPGKHGFHGKRNTNDKPALHGHHGKGPARHGAMRPHAQAPGPNTNKNGKAYDHDKRKSPGRDGNGKLGGDRQRR